MGYRQQLMEMLGALGNRIRDVDDKYAAAVKERLSVPREELGNSRINILRNMAAEVIGSPVTRGLGEAVYDTNNMGQRILHEGLRYGAPVASAGVRYVLPAAGVTAAGKGLYDLTQMLSPYREDEEE